MSYFFLPSPAHKSVGTLAHLTPHPGADVACRFWTTT